LASSTGADATAFGYFAGENLSSGAYSIAIGSRAMGGTTGGPNTGSYNTAIGNSSLAQNTTGNRNIAIGNEALGANQTGVSNVAIGSYQAAGGDAVLSLNVSGNYNTAVGAAALAKTTASNNTAVGYQAGFTNSAGQNLVAIGYQAGYTSNANNSTYVGYFAGQETTGTLNTFIGVNGVGYKVTTGTKNVIIGGYSGLATPISQGGSNYIVLSDGDANVRFVHNGATGATSLPGTSGSYSSSSGTFDSTLQIGSNLQLMSFASGANTQVQLTSNAYYSSGYKAIAGGAGSSKLYIGAAGIFEFAGSAVLTNAGDAITYTKTLDCGGLGASIALQNATSVTGTGITFPATQNASSDANTLDDYEEGTWTPGFATWTTAPTDVIALYTKIGRQVTLNIVGLGGICTAGSTITGIPFVAGSSAASILCTTGASVIGFTALLFNSGTEIMNVSAASMATRYWTCSFTYAT
jgi:hypothetical protein